MEHGVTDNILCENPQNYMLMVHVMPFTLIHIDNTQINEVKKKKCKQSTLAVMIVTNEPSHWATLSMTNMVA